MHCRREAETASGVVPPWTALVWNPTTHRGQVILIAFVAKHFSNGLFIILTRYEGTLMIENLLIEDQGKYDCMVKNNAGNAEGAVNLVIVTKPVIEEFLNIT